MIRNDVLEAVILEKGVVVGYLSLPVRVMATSRKWSVL